MSAHEWTVALPAHAGTVWTAAAAARMVGQRPAVRLFGATLDRPEVIKARVSASGKTLYLTLLLEDEGVGQPWLRTYDGRLQ